MMAWQEEPVILLVYDLSVYVRPARLSHLSLQLMTSSLLTPVSSEVTGTDTATRILGPQNTEVPGSILGKGMKAQFETNKGGSNSLLWKIVNPLLVLVGYNKPIIGICGI